MFKFDPYVLKAEDRQKLVKVFTMNCNSAGTMTYSDMQSRAIWAILVIVGFDVQAVTCGEMKCDGVVINRRSGLIVTTSSFDKIQEDVMATRWLNDLIDFTIKEICISTMANLDRIVDEVLAKVELATPLKPIRLFVGLVSPDVLMELPVNSNPRLEYPWFVKHTQSGDEVPKVGNYIGIHGPECSGIIRRIARGGGKYKHRIVCVRCSLAVTIPRYGMKYEELRAGIQDQFLVEVGGKVQK